MTSPNERDDERNARNDRFERLFQIARNVDAEDAPLPDHLTDTERHEVVRLSRLLTAIDDAWQAPEADKQRIHALFLQKLQAHYPGHPWVRTATVRTLGDLLLFDQSDVPTLPADTLARLKADSTPVQRLLDPSQRTAVVGRAIQQAGMPTSLITVFIHWLNQALSQLSPMPSAGSEGFQFTRRQATSKRPQTPTDEQKRQD